MRKLLLASAAILGASGGLALAQPVSPNQGQVVAPYGAGPTYNNVSNSWGNASLDHGSAAAGGLSSYAYIGQGLYPKPTPGTVVIRLGGKVEADIGAVYSSLTNFGAFKSNPVFISSYMRLYPGFDGLSANGIRYGAQIELRENWQNGMTAGGNGLTAGTGAAAAPGIQSPSANTSAQTVMVRRAYTYVASDQAGIIRLGQGDGIVGLFDPCIFASQCFDAGVGVYQSALFGTWGAANAGGGGANNYPWLSQAGAEYGNNKIVYLSPQFFGFDIGFQYAPSMGNGYQNGATNLGLPNAPSTAVLSEGNINITSGTTSIRWYNQVGVGVRFDKAFGPVDVKAFGFYGHAMNEAIGTYTTTPIGTAGFRTVSTNAMHYDPLSYYLAGLAVTTAGLTAAIDYVGGRVDNQLNPTTTGGAPTSATVVGLTYLNGPWTAGTAVGWVDTQGSTNLTGISQRHQFEVAIGGNYRMAPGINLVAEYGYYQTHQGGFNFATNSASAATGGAYNDVKSNAFIFTTMLTW